MAGVDRREILARKVGQRVNCRGVVQRFGLTALRTPGRHPTKKGTICIDALECDGRAVADHLWITIDNPVGRTEDGRYLALIENDRIAFSAKVKSYQREDGTVSYGLSRMENIRILGG